MTYYNYHAMAKRLIETGHLIAASIFNKYHHISPALVLYFDNHRPIPIREYRWDEYLEKVKKIVHIQNADNIDI